ncbi:MAG: response regulator, partial [Kiritimatiellia bacterium]|nr:response regulator [Kiritimatiellia bacterium]
LAAFEKDPDLPDLLICDLKMPGMDGMELCRRIRALRASLPVVILTAYAAEEVRDEALAIGIEHLVQKPFSPGPFLNLLRQLLSGLDACP